jgi:hypothetical protein
MTHAFDLGTEESMTMQLIAGSFAVVLAAGVAVAQTPATARRQGEPAGARGAQPEVTVIGCVEFEQDYRKRMAAGRGGVLGSGVGAADEFVLTNVRPPQDAVGTSGRGVRGSGAASPGPGGAVYTLTGAQEQTLKRDVGRQVEIIGVIENAGKPSTGAELTDVSDLPRIAITSWHRVGDFCPAR